MRLHLHQHHRTAVVVVLLAAAMLAIGGAAPAWAASTQPADAATPARPATSIATKVVLPETSIDGPALSSVVGTFEGQSTNESVLGWTGTDAAHHLNVATSKDGLHFGNKRTLGDTSPFRPDVTLIAAPAGLGVTAAWTGSDANHSLNVLADVYGTSGLGLKKLTLRDETSLSAPAILLTTSRGGITFLLAWTGTDAARSLNILPITLTGSSLVPGTKTILTQFSSNAGPHLAQRGGTTAVLNWTSRAGHLMVATSPDGVHFPDVSTSVQTSAFAPSTVSFDPQGPGAGDWMGWTGTDAAHHLNLQFTSSFPSFPLAATKTVLGDTALGGPALAFIGFPQLAWTGTDAAHHLNVARFEGF